MICITKGTLKTRCNHLFHQRSPLFLRYLLSSKVKSLASIPPPYLQMVFFPARPRRASCMYARQGVRVLACPLPDRLNGSAIDQKQSRV